VMCLQAGVRYGQSGAPYLTPMSTLFAASDFTLLSCWPLCGLLFIVTAISLRVAHLPSVRQHFVS